MDMFSGDFLIVWCFQMICHKICMHMRDLVNLHALFACVHTNLAPVLLSIYTDHT